jgi:hypothetical protein
MQCFERLSSGEPDRVAFESTGLNAVALRTADIGVDPAGDTEAKRRLRVRRVFLAYAQSRCVRSPTGDRATKDAAHARVNDVIGLSPTFRDAYACAGASMNASPTASALPAAAPKSSSPTAAPATSGANAANASGTPNTMTAAQTSCALF